MKKNVWRSIVSILLAVAIFAVVVALLRDFTKKLQDTASQQTQLFLLDNAAHSANLFDTELSGAEDSLTLASIYVSKLNANDLATAASTLALLRNAPISANYDRFLVMSEEGLVWTTAGGEPIDVSGDSFHSEILAGRPVIAEYDSRFSPDGKSIFIMLPVYKNGGVVGGIGVAYDAPTLEKMLDTQGFSGDAYHYVIDAEGNLIVGTQNPGALIHDGNVIETYRTSDPGNADAIARLEEDMRKGKTGFVNLDYHGNKRYLAYTPSSFNNWYILAAIPESFVSAQVTDLSEQAARLSIIIIAALGGVIVYVVVIQTLDKRALRRSHEETALSEERYKTIVDQAGNIVFEWNPVANQTYFSPRWYEYFDMKPPSGDLVNKGIDDLSLVHPDDREKFTGFMGRLASADPPKSLEFRLLTRTGEYIWVRVLLTFFHDAKGQLVRLLGTISDITKEHNEINELLAKSRTDPLTGLFNRMAAESLAGSLLADPAVKLSAFLIIDIDDFKQINDTYGHPCGDTILKKLAGVLGHVFRKTDIVARLGGDEFAVFAAGIPNKRMAMDKAGAILAAMRDSEAEPGCTTATVSIGIAFAPENGTSFAALYKKADSALYAVKGKGKGNCAAYEDNV